MWSDYFSLIEQVNAREKRPKIVDIPEYVFNHISLPASHLQLAERHGAEILKDFFGTHVFVHMTEGEINAFWAGRELARNDWKGLVRIVYSEIFGSSFQVPMEELDHKRCLEVKIFSFRLHAAA